MKKFELIKKYPGSPEIGCIANLEENHYRLNNDYPYLIQRDIIENYPEYWKEVDYDCTRCGKPCVCTAEEMYLDISGGD